MTPAVHRSFEELERRKNSLLAQLTQWSMERASFRPAPSNWSALGVLDHLVKVEQAALLDVQSRLPHGEPVPFKDRVGTYLVFAVMRSPLRVKTPVSSSTVLPQPAGDFAALAGQWEMVRNDLRRLLESLQPEQFRCGLFRHPVAGLMTIPYALTFLSVHLRHHGYQLNRLEKATSGF